MKYVSGLLLALILTSAAHAQQAAALAKFEPDSGYVYHGVSGLTSEVAAYTAAMDSTTQPYVRNLFYEIPGNGALSYSGLRALLAGEKTIGRFPMLSLDLTDGVIGTDSIIAMTTRYDAAIDSVARICKEFGRRIFVRPGFEFNAAWNGYHPYIFPAAFRKIVDRFRAVGADSVAFVWCYTPSAIDDFDSVDGRGARWYPGDGYVDWFGINLFFTEEFDILLPETDANGITPYGRTERFMQMARLKSRPVIIAEASAATMNITADSADGVDDWFAWFDPFFEFINAHPEVKGFCYINANWGGAWGNTMINTNGALRDFYVDEMLNTWYIHLRKSTPVVLAATILSAPADAVTLSGNAPVLQWFATPGAVFYHVQLATESSFAAPIVNDSSSGALSRALSPLAPGKYYWRVRAAAGTDRGPWSTVWSFTVPLAAPAQVQLLAPAPAAIVTLLDARLRWSASAPLVDRYWLEFGTDSTFVSASADTMVADTTVLRTGLVDGRRYWWRVRAHNSAGWGPFSAPRNFQVRLEPSAVPGYGPGAADAIDAIVPNPFGDRADLSFSLARSGQVRLVLLDAMGRAVRSESRELGAGRHSITIDASGLAAGAYVARLETQRGAAQARLLIVR